MQPQRGQRGAFCQRSLGSRRASWQEVKSSWEEKIRQETPKNIEWLLIWLPGGFTVNWLRVTRTTGYLYATYNFLSYKWIPAPSRQALLMQCLLTCQVPCYKTLECTRMFFPCYPLAANLLLKSWPVVFAHIFSRNSLAQVYDPVKEKFKYLASFTFKREASAFVIPKSITWSFQ